MVARIIEIDRARFSLLNQLVELARRVNSPTVPGGNLVAFTQPGNVRWRIRVNPSDNQTIVIAIVEHGSKILRVVRSAFIGVEHGGSYFDRFLAPIPEDNDSNRCVRIVRIGIAIEIGGRFKPMAVHRDDLILRAKSGGVEPAVRRQVGDGQTPIRDTAPVNSQVAVAATFSTPFAGIRADGIAVAYGVSRFTKGFAGRPSLPWRYLARSCRTGRRYRWCARARPDHGRSCERGASDEQRQRCAAPNPAAM